MLLGLASLVPCAARSARAADLGVGGTYPRDPRGRDMPYAEMWRDRRPMPLGIPRRRVTGGPDYVGSDYGLGKPSFYGIGPRPDWGRSTYD